MSVVIPLASRIHGPHYYKQLLKNFKDFFVTRNVKVLDVIDSEELITDDVLNALRGSTPIFFLLTGGTSRLSWKLLNLGNLRRALIFAHGGHNSLPSAISIKNRADVEGIPTKIYFCKDVSTSECYNVFDEAVTLSNNVTQISNTRVAVVSDVVDDLHSIFENITGIRTSLVGYDELMKLFEEVRNKEVDYYLSKLSVKLDLTGVNDLPLKNAIRMYLALKELVERNGFNAVSLDCFPLLTKYGITPCLAVSLLNDDGVPTACEADLRSLLLMLIAKAVGSWPAWIANIASVDGNRMVLAHCTIATGLARQCRITTHFESNYPYSLSCNLPSGTYTLVGINREFTTMAALKVRVLDSGSLFGDMCRTQVVVESEVDLNYFPNIALSNHHVLLPGDPSMKIKDVGYMLGLDFISYESLIKYLAEG
ncbi:MAG: hypothetical protein QW399_02735 [Sulfolobales archaeon]